MSITLPNYIFENPNLYETLQNEKFIVSKSSRYKDEKILLRNSMHIAILLIDGGKILHLKDEDINIDTSDILFLSQGNYFMSEKLGDKNSFESILVFFDDEFILDFIKRYDFHIDAKDEKSMVSIKRDTFLDSYVATINEYIKTDIENKSDFMRLKIDELFLYTFSKNKETFSSFLKTILSTKASRVKYILEANIDIIHSLEDMCKLTRLNSKALRKEMLKLYNQNPKEWLDSKRLLQAGLLLTSTEKTVSQIATECGYSSVSWFINQFKKYHKTTPLEYKQQNL